MTDPQDILDALPETARQLLPALGLAALSRLCQEGGGRRLYIGLRQSPATAALLSDAEHASVLRFFGAGWIDVPQLRGATRLLRDNAIRAAFDNGADMDELIDRFGLTQRTLRRILNRSA